jgi:hypothetical protein
MGRKTNEIFFLTNGNLEKKKDYKNLKLDEKEW